MLPYGLCFVSLLFLPNGFESIARLQPKARQLHGSGQVQDPLPSKALLRYGSNRFRHGGPIVWAAFVPKSRNIISVGNDNRMILWDSHTGLPQSFLETSKKAGKA